MKIVSLLFTTFFLFSFTCVFGQSNINYGENYVVFEAEDTDSPLGKWALRTPSDPKYYKGDDLEAINQTYIEFTGGWASKESPLHYTFTCPKTGKYRLLMRLYQPLTESEKGDQKNDVFIRLEGNYTSETSKPKSELEKDHKFWGRGVRKWGTCYSLEIGGGHLHARYGLIEGEEYTLIMSGRSPGASLDYIMFYEDTPSKGIGNTDLATQFPEEYRPVVASESIQIVSSDTSIRDGSTLQLGVNFEPSNANSTVVWTSSNEQVFTVDEDGLVRAIGNIGDKATVIVNSTVSDLSAEIELEIVEWYAILLDEINVSPKSNYLEIGDTKPLQLDINPLNADDTSVTWSSSDEKVATINQQGLVEAVGLGNATITVQANDSGEVATTTEIFVGQLYSQAIYWNAKEIMGEEDILTDGTLIEAINFSGGTNANDFNTVLNGVEFEGLVNGSETNEWDGPESMHFYSSSKQVVPETTDIYDANVGLSPFDNAMSNFLWDGAEGPSKIAIKNLQVGEKYKLQFLVGDTRSSQSGSYILIDDQYGSNKKTSYAVSNGLSIIGEFVAQESMFYFTFGKVKGGEQTGINLNAYQLRKVPNIISSFSESTKNQGALIYPNPSSGSISVSLKQGLVNTQVCIYTMTGKCVYQQELKENKQSIDVSSLFNGLYIIQVVNDETTLTQKLQIEK
ncbi:T9SS type A sorting domain-containing protein [Sediminitomix flava]|uniref:Putative secreted protein (Por secretion system target) n=1 Tax=Sediminitomix flava TaxID=379075 RepID=A0A315ZST9_SEDFL|nr:Ig-like domain-containing protein [Sediminitomix flava]PWJ37920.1 putative secreted protein (Por secretion system target) [Sediminitomix flava]